MVSHRIAFDRRVYVEEECVAASVCSAATEAKRHTIKASGVQCGGDEMGVCIRCYHKRIGSSPQLHATDVVFVSG